MITRKDPSAMARRVPMTDTNTAIQYIGEDGGVILTGFTSVRDVEQVNSDAEPYISAILKDVHNEAPQSSTLTFQHADDPASIHHDLYQGRRLDAPVYLDEAPLHEKRGCNSPHFWRS